MYLMYQNFLGCRTYSFSLFLLQTISRTNKFFSFWFYYNCAQMSQWNSKTKIVSFRFDRMHMRFRSPQSCSTQNRILVSYKWWYLLHAQCTFHVHKFNFMHFQTNKIILDRTSHYHIASLKYIHNSSIPFGILCLNSLIWSESIYCIHFGEFSNFFPFFIFFQAFWCYLIVNEWELRHCLFRINVIVDAILTESQCVYCIVISEVFGRVQKFLNQHLNLWNRIEADKDSLDVRICMTHVCNLRLHYCGLWNLT